MLSNKFQVGGDATAAAGPVGRHASAGTDWKADSQILTYSRAKGLFAGNLPYRRGRAAGRRFNPLHLSQDDRTESDSKWSSSVTSCGQVLYHRRGPRCQCLTRRRSEEGLTLRAAKTAGPQWWARSISAFVNVVLSITSM